MSEKIATHIHDLLLDYLSQDGFPVFSSGFPSLDRALEGGFVPGSIYVFGGFPSVGKSSFALSISRRMADAGRRVIYLSLEMTGKEMAERFLCQHTRKTRVQLEALRKAKQLEALTQPIVAAAEKTPFMVADSLTGDKTDLLLLIERTSPTDPKPEVLIIDHLQHQLFSEGLSRVDAISNYMVDVKALSKRHQLVTLICSQFNRTSRNEKKTELWHLKGSGAIEEVADAILLCDNANLDKIDLASQSEPTEFTVRIAKHRRGPRGEFTLIFHPTCYEFDEPISGWQPRRRGAEEVKIITEPDNG